MSGNKITDKITKLLRILSQNKSQSVRSETENTMIDTKIPKETYIFPEEKQKSIVRMKIRLK